MLRNSLIKASALLIASYLGVAHAESVSGGVLTPFPSLGSAASPTYGNAYWNNNSGDGPAANVGWCLTGGGQCSLPGGAPGALSYYSATGAAGGSNAPTDLYFTNGGSSVSTTLLISLTSMSPNDTFGWYSADATGNPVGGVGGLHYLFTGNQAVTTASLMLTPNQNYGFYIAQQNGSTTNPFSFTTYFLMNSAANFVGGNDPANPGDALQHFAVFQQNSSSFYIGVADTRACAGSVTSTCDPTSMFDFNNPVVHLQVVPEPASIALLGAGLLAAGAAIRRRRTR